MTWLVATTLFTSYAQTTEIEEEAQFVATTQDGTAYLISANGTIDQMLDYTILEGNDVDQPPLVSTYIDESSNQQITKIIQLPTKSNLSSLSCPTHVYGSVYVYIDSNGDIILYDLATEQVLDELQSVNALLDGSIVEAPQDVFYIKSSSVDVKTKLFAVYGGSTSFSHCVLGDCLEGSTLIFIQVTQQQQQSNINNNSSELSKPKQCLISSLIELPHC